MSIISRLSSQLGEKTEEGNRNVAKECLLTHSLLGEISEGLTNKDTSIMGDCAEVFTKVAEVNPELVVPFASPLMALLTHKTTRVRWEAMHAVSLITPYIPNQISSLLPQINESIQSDKSTIVRDYAIDTVCHYANTGEQEAELVFPLLKEALHLWEGKHTVLVS